MIFLKRKYSLMHFLFIAVICSFSQNTTFDSLTHALKKASHDTIRCALLTQLAETAPETEWQKFNDELKDLSEKRLAEAIDPKLVNTYKRHLATALNNYGYLCDEHGETGKALDFYFKSRKIQEEIGDLKGLATSQNNIGSIYQNLGQVKEALVYFTASLRIIEKINDKYGMAAALNNIGSIYQSQFQIEEALECYHKSAKINQEIGDKRALATCLNNIGTVYDHLKQPAQALEYYNRSLKIREENGFKSGIAYSLNNIGAVYKYKREYKEALKYFERSLKLYEEMQDLQGIGHSACNLGTIYLLMRNNSKALQYGNRSLSISRQIGFPELTRSAAKLLSDAYEQQGNGMKAFEMYKLYISMRDSITNSENKRASIQRQYKYEYEKKAAADSVAFSKSREIKNAQIEKQGAELKSKRTQQYFLFGGLALVVVLAGFMYNRFRVTQKQKKIIEEQKKVVEGQKAMVEVKQKEVLDSIYYARRIQRALITNETYINNKLLKLNSK